MFIMCVISRSIIMISCRGLVIHRFVRIMRLTSLVRLVLLLL